MESKPLIDSENRPIHIAVIMDGNGRWAKEKGKDRIHGHKEGVVSVREVVQGCGEAGIKYLTLYAFSTENWNRPKYEVDALMELLVSTIRKEVNELKKDDVRLHVIGDLEALPGKCQIELAEAIEITKDCERLNLILALSYSSRWEIINVTKNIATAVLNKEMDVADIDNDTFKKYLCTAAFPDPELMIRTGGERRISNFLLYQSAYTELYFTEVQWPDFRKKHLFEAIINYQHRERRFGKTSEQVKKPQH